MMFDLKAVAYMRGHFQILQKYEHDEEEGIVNIEDTASTYSRSLKPLERVCNEDRRHSIELDVETEVESSVSIKDLSLKDRFSGILSAKSAPTETSTYQAHQEITFTDVGSFDENRQKSPLNNFFFGVSRGQANHSFDTLPAPTADQNSEIQRLSPLNLQERKIQRQCEPITGTKQLQLPKSSQALSENSCRNHTSQKRVAYPNTGSEHISATFSRQGRLVGRLTTLSECSGNPPASQSLEKALPILGM